MWKAAPSWRLRAVVIIIAFGVSLYVPSLYAAGKRFVALVNAVAYHPAGTRTAIPVRPAPAPSSGMVMVTIQPASGNKP